MFTMKFRKRTFKNLGSLVDIYRFYKQPKITRVTAVTHGPIRTRIARSIFPVFKFV